MNKSVGDFDAFANNYEQKFQDALGVFAEESNYFARYKIDLLAHLVANSEIKSILDYGSGIGASIPHLRNNFPDSQIWATDIYVLIGGEPLGISGLLLSACLAGMIGFYVWFTQKRIGVDLPEDNLTAEISDGAGELGFYSPHSWWPLPVALSACTLGLGLLIGWWLSLIGLGALMISVIGMVTEYEKPATSTSH
jgi:hypothetical protein